VIESDFDEFSDVLVAFAELKSRQLSPVAIKLFWNTMRGGWELPEFKAAAEHLLRSCDWLPTPKHFEDLRKAGRPTAAEAWERARRASGTAIQHGQVTHNGTCGDELIDRAVRGIGGYGVIAMCETDKLPFLERRFAEHYGDLQGVEDVRAAVPQITQEHSRVLRGPTSAAAVLARLGADRLNGGGTKQ
jgi:hypothetical protein